jgi:hypothetical protein
VRVLIGHDGSSIRLSEERLAHILEHPEMEGLSEAIGLTIRRPELIVRSSSDAQARLYYRYHRETLVGDKYLCVVVKLAREDAFVVTAYLTDRIKRGSRLWPRST